MTRKGLRLVLRIVLLATLAGGPAVASALDETRLYLAARGEIPWQSLSPEEQDALHDYRDRWNSFDSAQQQRIRRGAQRYLELPPGKRREIRQEHHHYRQLSPEERRRLREEYQRHRR